MDTRLACSRRPDTVERGGKVHEKKKNEGRLEVKVLRLPKALNSSGYCRLRILTLSNTEFRSKEKKGRFVFALRRGILDFGLIQGINRAREDEFVILAWD